MFGIALAFAGSSPVALAHAPDALQIKRLDAQVRSHPKDIELLLRRANLLCIAGRVDAAARDYGQVLSLDPHRAEAHLGLAKLFLKGGLLPEAQRALHSCDSGEPQVQAEKWKVQAGIFAAQSRWMDAGMALDRAMALDPNPRPEDFNQRADFAISAGRLDEALAILERGIERLNGAAALRWRAIAVAIRAQRTELALAQLDELEKVMPGSALVAARRGDVFAACGRNLDASAAWTEALARIESTPHNKRTPSDDSLANRLRRNLQVEQTGMTSQD
jgi:tetratricopeptide (TPR) repeat protein